MAKARITATITLEYEFEPGKTEGWDYLEEGCTAQDYVDMDVEGFHPDKGGDISQLIDDPNAVIEVKGEVLDA